MGIIYPRFSKPLCKFLNQMVFGLQASKDIKLSHVARALDESIALKKTEERLSRNLKTEGLDEKLNTLIASQGASRIGKDTLKRCLIAQRSMMAAPGNRPLDIPDAWR